MNSAAAQVVIQHGDYDSDFEKYLIVAVSLAALVFAVWRCWVSRRQGVDVRYSPKRTLAVRNEMSALGHKQTHAPQQTERPPRSDLSDFRSGATD